MEKVERFSISISPKLLKKFDALLKEKRYASRSEGIRDLIRDCLVADEWTDAKGEVVGSLTLLYDHEVRGISDRLTDVQHEYAAHILASMHVHLDGHNCLEVLIISGSAGEVKKIADRLISSRGVKHGKLVMTTKGEHLE